MPQVDAQLEGGAERCRVAVVPEATPRERGDGKCGGIRAKKRNKVIHNMRQGNLILLAFTGVNARIPLPTDWVSLPLFILPSGDASYMFQSDVL